jgi:cell division septation protein DedD
MGYLLGKSSSAGGRTEIIATSPSSSTAGKPSGANKTPEAVPSAPAATDTSTPAKAPDQPAAQQPAANASQNPSTPSPAANTSDGAPGSFMVQVAAVSKQEDADILVSSLQKKQYPVFIASSPGDPLFHVQVGPFSDKKDADAMKTRLAGDGYNAIVK